jgi:hypothetical protein
MVFIFLVACEQYKISISVNNFNHCIPVISHIITVEKKVCNELQNINFAHFSNASWYRDFNQKFLQHTFFTVNVTGLILSSFLS